MTALVIALFLVPVTRPLGSRLRLVDRPAAMGHLKIHRQEMPLVGGVVIVVSTFATAIAMDQPPIVGIIAGVILAMLVGLVDDVRPLPVWPRLVLLGLAGLLVSPALQITGWSPAVTAGMVVLVVVSANAVNILDGQDGLAGGLVAIAALALASFLPVGERAAWSLGMALAGATLGFLAWNRPPARVFLGNNGAYALGAVLAVLSGAVISVQGWKGVGVVGACLSVFAFEVVSTLFRRWRLGRSLTGGDRLHSYDLLARRLASRERSTLVFIGLGGFAWILGSVMMWAPLPIGLALLAGGLVGAVVACAWLWRPRGVPQSRG